MRILSFYSLSAFISTNSVLQIASSDLFDRNSKQRNILTTTTQQFNTLITRLQKVKQIIKATENSVSNDVMQKFA